MDNLGQVDKFIRDIDAAQNVEAVYAVLRKQIDLLGFERFSYQVMEPPTGKAKKFYLSTYPQEWIKRYNEQKYISDDIRGRYGARMLRPFLFTDVGRLSDFTPAQRIPINEGGEFGIKTGAGVPIQGAGLLKILFVVTSSLPQEEFTKLFAVRRHVLHLIATYTHERLVQLGFHDLAPRALKLTPREIEVLTWAARGETSDSTAAKLSISVETVTRHLTNVCQKLNTHNKTHATAVALLHGLILP